MDAINVVTPQCRDCDRLAVGFVRWPQHRITDSPWTPKCDQHVPWQDPDALVVGIRQLGATIDPDPPGQRRPPPDDHDPPEDDDHDPADVGYWIDGRRP